MSEQNVGLNTNRELWREDESAFAASLFVTEDGGIGINVGGLVIVQPLRVWHEQAARLAALERERDDGLYDVKRVAQLIETYRGLQARAEAAEARLHAVRKRSQR